MPEVRVIQPVTIQTAEKLRVAAYARVSSDSTDQRNSFSAQVKYYTQFIQAHEDWQFVDIYADQGITGTRTEKREDFLRLMRDCRQGKIDRILVKSVSRFARNAQDCIKAVRELKNLDVTVFFEKERINTSVMSNEMFLSMMSAFAQEESISISKNMRKGAVMRMQNGTFRLSQIPYGYRCDQNGKLVICEEEASVVRYIYERFLQGAGIHQIAAQLIKAEVPKLNGKPVWSRHGILYILTNERYMGDELYRKSYRSEEIPFKKIDNHGEKAQFYAENTHEGIISKETFEKVQVLLQGKSQKFGQDQKNEPYTFSGKLRCAECGSVLYRRVTARGIRWVCSRHLHHPDQCGQKGIPEDLVQDRFQILLHKLSQNRDAILGEYLKQLQELKDRELFLHPDAMELNRLIAEPNLAERSVQNPDFLSIDAMRLTREINRKLGDPKADTDELLHLIQQCAQEKYRVCTASGWENQRIAEYLAGQQPAETADTTLFEKIVKSVIVSGGEVSIRLTNGVILS